MRRFLLMAAIISGLAAPAFAENRVALVIGNDDYERLPAAQQLHNAVNDARTMKTTLEGLGFKVAIKENVRRIDLIDALSDFAARIGKDDIAFFFYAGHGVSLNGANYILPIDISPPRSTGRDEEEKLTDLAVAETRITDRIRRANARVAVVVLDACRDNPLASPGGRSIGASRGLAPPPESRGVLSIYSAGAGQQALDNLGEADAAANSVFTRVFARKLKTPGLGLREAAFETQGEVAALATGAGHEQVPGVYSQIIGEDVFLAGRNLAVAPVAEAEQAAFDAAMQADTAVALEGFLGQHGTGPLASIAGRELARLTRLAALPPPTAVVIAPPSPPMVNTEPAEFETAMQADTVVALDAFLGKGTKGPLADMARRERERLTRLAALPVPQMNTSTEKTANNEFEEYEFAEAADRLDIYEAFIAKYPNGAWTGTMGWRRDRLRRLAGLPVPQINTSTEKTANNEFEEYEFAEAADRLDIYEAFIAKYPNGAWTATMRSQRDRLMRLAGLPVPPWAPINISPQNYYVQMPAGTTGQPTKTTQPQPTVRSKPAASRQRY